LSKPHPDALYISISALQPHFFIFFVDFFFLKCYHTRVVYIIIIQYMNTLKKLALTTAATAITLEQSFAAISLGGDKVKGEISGSTEGADTAVQNLWWISYGDGWW
jgi:uncharacterized membrane protein YadS